MLLTQLIHEVDALLIIMGRPESVSARMDTRYAAIESEDYVEAVFRFPGGRTAKCSASVNSGTRGGHFVVQGDLGTAALPWKLTLDDSRHAADVEASLSKELPEHREANALVARGWRFVLRRLGVPVAGRLTPHAHLYADIARRIDESGELPIPAAEAVESLEACAAAYESALTGTEVRFPLTPANAAYRGVSTEEYRVRKCVRA